MIQQQFIDYGLSAHTVLARIRNLGHPVLLDSSQPYARGGRYDIISAAPDRIIRFGPAGLQLLDSNLCVIDTQSQDPFTCLEQCLSELGQPNTDDDLPFCGGLIGVFGYDLGRVLEKLPQHAQADIDYPWLNVGRYLWAVVIDHETRTSRLISHSLASADLINQVKQCLNVVTAQDSSTPGFRLTQPFHSNLTATGYHEALSQIDDYIHAGDCYQINFAQRFQTRHEGDPWQAYTALNAIAPTPFAAYMESELGTILSLSPERFLLSERDGSVETRPIKGTRPRGRTEQEDKALAQELAESPKDRSENLMIVDLLRNDLSRSCSAGSINVPELFSIEHYPNVHHLVSVIRGQLKQSATPLTLLRDAFPGGSITGAPKIRAMEIIDELEPQRRSIYCGSIGYISCCGRMDTSITIRTLLCQQGQIYCWAGGGIVADSSIEEEYQETFNKVNNLISCLEGMN